MKAFIMKDRCAAQEVICKPLSQCANHAISFVPDETEPLGGRMLVDESSCVGCGSCVPLCCGSAIGLR